jgi:DNA processing protein
VTSLQIVSGAPCAPVPSLLDPRDPDPVARDALLAWLRVQAAFGYQPQDACTALRNGIPPAALWPLAGGEARARAERLAPDGPLWRALEACSAQALPWTSELYPERLRRLSDAPPLLFVQGDPAWLERRCVAVVGARAASAYGRRIASELGAALARAGIVVVSGLAHGVDGCAHSGALEAGGPTLAVQGRGPDKVYPASHRALAGRIRASGALLSEFAPRVPPRAAHFPLRNRIISALSEAVVVVEARVRSGSLVTARHALDQGVDVLVVPGPVDAPTSEGSNRLLRDGAGAVLEPGDVLRALGVEPEPVARRAGGPPAAQGESARELVAALRDAPATRDELAERLGRPPEALALALAELELEGWIEAGHDGRLRLTRAR